MIEVNMSWFSEDAGAEQAVTTLLTETQLSLLIGMYGFVDAHHG